jgi:hypothetical protein
MRVLCTTLLLVVAPLPAIAQQVVRAEEVRALINGGRCAEARRRIQGAANRDEFLSTAVGQALYAGSLCYSPPSEINVVDITNALAHARVARHELRDLQPALNDWLDGVEVSCQQLERMLGSGPRRAIQVGKNLGPCRNASGTMLRWSSSPPRSPPALLATFRWTPIAAAIREAGDTAARPAPAPEELRTRVRTEHVGAAEVASCLPFVVAATDWDPNEICRGLLRFYRYFRNTYGAGVPSGWIVIHYYASATALSQHARRLGGPACDGLLGYYDWRTQSIAFAATGGSLGTLQHELVHAFVFWDLPMAPRWFDEGLAALYENTNPEYGALPNPWREEILRDYANPREAFLGEVLGLPLSEFDARPEPATLARAVLMDVQRGNRLTALYRAMRKEPLSDVWGSNPDAALWQSPPARDVERWRALVLANLP